MYDICEYQLHLKGDVNEASFNATSPVCVRVMPVDGAHSRITFKVDQSGLVGLLRHLHQQGFVLLSLSRDEPAAHSRR